MMKHKKKHETVKISSSSKAIKLNRTKTYIGLIRDQLYCKLILTIYKRYTR